MTSAAPEALDQARHILPFRLFLLFESYVRRHVTHESQDLDRATFDPHPDCEARPETRMTRKTSMPYPTSPPPQPPLLPNNPGPQSNFEPDWAAESREPLIANGPSAMTDKPNFHEADNPWSELPPKGPRSDRPLPGALKSGQTPSARDAPINAGGQSLANIPSILRAGHSQEDTPRSSLDSDRSKDFWEDSDDGQEGRKSPKRGKITLPEGDASDDPWVKLESPDERSSAIKRKPVGSGSSPAQSTQDLPGPGSFASNNPFRRPSEHPEDVALQAPEWAQSFSPFKGKGPDTGHNAPQSDHFQDLTTTNNTGPSFPSYGADPVLSSPWGQGSSPRMPPMPQAPPPPVPGPQSPFSSQPPLIPVSPRNASNENPWASNPSGGAPTPSPIPFPPSQKQVSSYNDDLLDRGKQGRGVFLRGELEAVPNAAHHTGTAAPEEPSLLDDEDAEDEDRPALPIRPVRRAETEYFEPPAGPPPTKPPRPIITTIVPSDEEVARNIEQRNETYQIKHFNWFDHSSRKLRRSSMLTQNKNGPCPLLALVNALILGAKDESQAALDDALRTREQVSLGLIIETLMDELLSRGFDAVGEVMPDVDELNDFLMRLRTGMNANPRFVPASSPPPNLIDADDSVLNLPQYQGEAQRLGTFETTTDMKLYGAFQIPLIHGWLPEPGSDAAKAFARSAQTYEDAQALQFGEEELEYKLSRQGLTDAEENMWRDINSIKTFLTTFPTQLTPGGLEAVQESIRSGSFAIMFRNDHFSTIYKHPESGQLLTLITDAGYADRDEIIWESLVDVNGKHNEFFSGDFMPVGNNEPTDESSTHPAARRTSQLLAVNDPSSATALSPQEVQEQHDADFAMALQLQEEEEQRQRAERNRRRNSGNAASNTPQPRRPRAGDMPTPVRSTSHQQQSSSQPSAPEVRAPPMPPRNAHVPNPAVNRPTDGMTEDAPPLYEEAVKVRPYIPPIGSPLHPSSEPSPMNSNTQLTGTLSNISQHSAEPPVHPPGPNALRRNPQRRTSAYNEMQAAYPGSGRLHPQSAIAGPSGRNGRAREDRDCIVM